MGIRRKAVFPVAVIAAIIMMLSLADAGGQGTATADTSDPLYTFAGSGRAHGVGMCMDGVLYRALGGQTYHEILSYYYTGISYSRIDDNRPVRVLCRDGQIRVYAMHQYLYRLQEEPEDRPIEELKGLYAAARTYVLSCIARNKHTAQGFDVCSSGNCCQAFDENKDLSRYPKNVSAVDATTGEIMTYGGQPITAAYCGSCGGHTENNEDVWGGSPIPYLRGKPDDYCKNSARFSWTVNLYRSEIEAKLNVFADSQVGTLFGIEILSRTPGGRVRQARVVGSLGSKVVPGGTLSARLGFQSSLWDLAQKKSNFDEYILVLNPNKQSNVMTFTFMRQDGTTSDHVIEVAGNSRYTLKVNDYEKMKEVSTRVISELPIVAERAMYFNYQGKTGGSASTGVTSPAPMWYFAEGYTGGSFDTYILVENPQQFPADIKFTFMVPGGGTVEKTAQAAPCSRMTVHVDEIPGLENTDVSTKVECTNGERIVAERAEYFGYRGWDDGNAEAGVTSTAKKWYLAEGYTAPNFDTYVEVQNPGAHTASVQATFMREDGRNIVQSFRLPPRSRYTIAANGIPGLENTGFSTKVVSTNGAGIIAEHSMFYNYEGIPGGSDGKGVSTPSPDWFFAEGYTGGKFDTYVLIQNPGSAAARVRATFTKFDGTGIQKDYTIKPKSRFTIPLDKVAGLENAEVSTAIHSLNGVGVIAERAMYFVYENGLDSRAGGHDAVGVKAPSTTWYFAEGYTGY